MITLNTIRGANLITTEPKEFWMIARKPSQSKHVIHVPELAPSRVLFQHYLYLREQGSWNQESFDMVYAPWFLRDFKESPKAMMLMNYLCLMDERKDIELLCWCADEKKCHRSIIAGLLKGIGASIECPDEYLKYYEQWQKL